jgi:endonuclease VIII
MVATSPQGRFADGAAVLDGCLLTEIDAYGKHLLYRFDDGPLLHVHLGLFGRFTTHRGDAPPPRGAIRLRLEAAGCAVDLRGPTTCALIDPDDEARLIARLGPDPLRPDADPDRAYARIARSDRAIGALLLDQSVIAGVGNVYRAEALFVLGIHPARPGRDITRDEFEAIWSTVSEMLRDGVRAGRIVTVRPEDAGGVPRSRLRRGDRTYVYRQAACRRCGSDVRSWDMAGRRAWACPACQS